MPKDVFRFKRFDCRHGMSSMKIGVDAVLVAAWADVEGARSILDVGCGCGVISLICAQRAPLACIRAIDIDMPSVMESGQNFSLSPWSDRLSAERIDFNALNIEDVDLIISNPPYFDAGLSQLNSARLTARHQDALSPARILERAPELLSAHGSVAMVVPAEQMSGLEKYALTLDLSLKRSCLVRGHDKAPAKRALLQFVGNAFFDGVCERSSLTLEIEPGMPTPQHRALCKDLYLKY